MTLVKQTQGLFLDGIDLINPIMKPYMVRVKIQFQLNYTKNLGSITLGMAIQIIR